MVLFFSFCVVGRAAFPGAWTASSPCLDVGRAKRHLAKRHGGETLNFAARRAPAPQFTAVSTCRFST